MNVEDQVTYIVLKTLVNEKKDNQKAYQDAIAKAQKVDPNSQHLVADTVRLIDYAHNQFLNCTVTLKNKVTPVPEADSGKGDAWVTHVGQLELKRLITDYQK